MLQRLSLHTVMLTMHSTSTSQSTMSLSTITCSHCFLVTTWATISQQQLVVSWLRNISDLTLAMSRFTIAAQLAVDASSEERVTS